MNDFTVGILLGLSLGVIVFCGLGQGCARSMERDIRKDSITKAIGRNPDSCSDDYPIKCCALNLYPDGGSNVVCAVESVKKIP